MDMLDFSWKPEQGFEQGSQGTQAASMEEKIRQVRKMKWSRNTAVSPFPHQGTTRPREANSLVPSWMW